MGGAGVIVDLGGGRGHLREGAAKSLHRVDKRIGHRAQITEALRSWSQQNAHWQHYLKYGAPIALHPDTPSIHQLGEAVDSDELQNHIALMEDHGWFRTVYRWVNGVWTLVERWHFEYDAARDNHRHEVVTLVRTPNGAWRLPTPEEEAPPAIEEDESEEDTMKMLGYTNPADDRVWYAQFDTSSGFWSEFVSSDKEYIRSIGAKWTPDGIPMVTVGHRNDLKDECDRISGRSSKPRAVTGAAG